MLPVIKRILKVVAILLVIGAILIGTGEGPKVRASVGGGSPQTLGWMGGVWQHLKVTHGGSRSHSCPAHIHDHAP
jgi:preprotein translocase subunit SecG